MSERYRIDHPEEILSPGLVLFEDLLIANLAKMIEIAGSAERLRPHCKTNKLPEVIQKEVALGITKHKAATIAECEMLAEAGAQDILLAYNPVGPNIDRVVSLRKTYPKVRISVTADHPHPLQLLDAACDAAGVSLSVFLDVNVGMNRTGIRPGESAHLLYRQIHESIALDAAGFHVYDGHHRFPSIDERTEVVGLRWKEVQSFRDALQADGLSVETVVAGGTPTFPVYASYEDAGLELSPGTCVLHDARYGRDFPDLDFTPAALLLGRVISIPADDRITLDLGSKSVAADPPAGTRLFFPEIPDADQVMQSEEHLVVRTCQAGALTPGDHVLAIPTHICPTVAAHQNVTVVRNGEVIDTWTTTARDRKLTI